MAAAIKNKFGLTAELKEGHNGIYEVAVNGNVIYSNPGSCSQRPKEDEIFREIQKYTEPLSGRLLKIEFLYLDLSVCTWCQSTDSNLEEAIADVTKVLEATGVAVNFKKIHVQSEEQSRELGFVTSPTIRINGRDIQLDVKEALCDSCGDLCGDSVDCRIWTYQGKEYTAPPKGMIIDAIFKEIYGGSKESQKISTASVGVPDNLKKFFAGKQRKTEQNTSQDTGNCCCTSNQKSC